MLRKPQYSFSELPTAHPLQSLPQDRTQPRSSSSTSSFPRAMMELPETSLSLWQLRSSLPRASSPQFRLLHPDHLQQKCSLSNSASQKDRRAKREIPDRLALRELTVHRVQQVRLTRFQSEQWLPAALPRLPLQVMHRTRHSILCCLKATRETRELTVHKERTESLLI